MDRDDGAGEESKAVVSKKLKEFVEGHAKKLEAVLLEMANEVVSSGVSYEDRIQYTTALWMLLDAEAGKVEYAMCNLGIATPELFDKERIKNRIMMAMVNLGNGCSPVPEDLN